MHAGNDDSVLNLKRELRDHLSNQNRNQDDGEEGSTPTATTASTSEQVNIASRFLIISPPLIIKHFTKGANFIIVLFVPFLGR